MSPLILKYISPKLLAIVLLTCITFSPFSSHAGMETEIDHLLRYIETSDCEFNRNGSIHNSQDAGKHIRRKYAHTKRWIKSTEDFITYAATKSSTTGKTYKVICGELEMPTAEWLREELGRFRETSQ